MKIKKIIPSLLIITVLLCGVAFNAFAMNTGFTTDDMELDEQQAFLSNINLSLVTEEPEKNAIDCFDVNDDGLIAIGSQNSTSKIISVYTSDGAFKYGYKFDCDGSFGVEWDNGNIDKSKDIIPNLVANHLGINRFGKGETKWNYL